MGAGGVGAGYLVMVRTFRDELKPSLQLQNPDPVWEAGRLMLKKEGRQVKFCLSYLAPQLFFYVWQDPLYGS